MGDSTNRKNDVDHQAEADLVEMSKERRHAIEALTEERQRYKFQILMKC